MATTQDSNNNSEGISDGKVDRAVELIAEDEVEKYSKAYNMLSKSYTDPKTGNASDYRDPSILINNLDEDIAEELSAVVNPEEVTGKRLERSKRKLKEFADNYLENSASGT
ncbi:hypothetical protein [Candidatus Nanohalobium constans]|uniref:Uncharacterized protein n=1 Tax=Candidatus Nanohalobium constans TaxID=2565781 RepID=A0A5Q0UG93_9ARCH|nr:hypothetical protein [Candidatus Nanohalobium constans]QGA80220.1 hypothetical protein LC1Nh_0317 [Candidatus Nanohalobium constans]